MQQQLLLLLILVVLFFIFNQKGANVNNEPFSYNPYGSGYYGYKNNMTTYYLTSPNNGQYMMKYDPNRIDFNYSTLGSNVITKYPYGTHSYTYTYPYYKYQPPQVIYVVPVTPKPKPAPKTVMVPRRLRRRLRPIVRSNVEEEIEVEQSQQ